MIFVFWGLVVKPLIFMFFHGRLNVFRAGGKTPVCPGILMVFSTVQNLDILREKNESKKNFHKIIFSSKRKKFWRHISRIPCEKFSSKDKTKGFCVSLVDVLDFFVNRTTTAFKYSLPSKPSKNQSLNSSWDY